MGTWDQAARVEMHNEANNKKVDLSLVELARFLNTDLEDPAEKQLQKEISNDVTPFIEEREDRLWLSGDPSHSLGKLLEKINSLPIRIKWHWGGDFGEKIYYREGRRGLKVPGKGNLAFIERYPHFEVKEPRQMRAVSISEFLFHRNSARGPISLRLAFYWVIIEALESAEFNRLNRCELRGCGKFFVAGRKGQRFCGLECVRANDREAARKRAKDWRNAKKKEEQKRAEQQQRRAKQSAELKAFKRFVQFINLTKENLHSDDELSKIRPILIALGQGNMRKAWSRVKVWQKKSPKDVWTSLSEKEKEFFQS